MSEVVQPFAVFRPGHCFPDLRLLTSLEVLEPDAVVPLAVDLVLPRVCLICALELASFLHGPARPLKLDLHLVLLRLAAVQLRAPLRQDSLVSDEHLAHDEVMHNGGRPFNRVDLVVSVQLDVT